jgi:hypothetical protein
MIKDNKHQYDEKGNLIFADWGNGAYSKRTYNEKGDIIFDEGIGNKSLKPFWVKWERYYHEDGSREIYLKDNTGYWYEEKINKCNRVVDHVNSHLAKAKNVKFRGEEYLYGKVTSC